MNGKISSGKSVRVFGLVYSATVIVWIAVRLGLYANAHHGVNAYYNYVFDGSFAVHIVNIAACAFVGVGMMLYSRKAVYLVPVFLIFSGALSLAQQIYFTIEDLRNFGINSGLFSLPAVMLSLFSPFCLLGVGFAVMYLLNKKPVFGVIARVFGILLLAVFVYFVFSRSGILLTLYMLVEDPLVGVVYLIYVVSYIPYFLVGLCLAIRCVYPIFPESRLVKGVRRFFPAALIALGAAGIVIQTYGNHFMRFMLIRLRDSHAYPIDRAIAVISPIGSFIEPICFIGIGLFVRYILNRTSDEGEAPDAEIAGEIPASEGEETA